MNRLEPTFRLGRTLCPVILMFRSYSFMSFFLFRHRALLVNIVKDFDPNYMRALILQLKVYIVGPNNLAKICFFLSVNGE